MEHVDELTKYVLGLSLRASLTNWAEGALETFVAELSDDEAELVRAVNRHVGAGQLCPRVELAAELGLSIDAVAFRVQEMADRAWGAGLPALVLVDHGALSRPGSEGDLITYSIPLPLVARVYAALDARVSPDQPG
jgi:hypothetical protein